MSSLSDRANTAAKYVFDEVNQRNRKVADLLFRLQKSLRRRKPQDTELRSDKTKDLH